MIPKIPDQVYIRHNCDCATSTEPPSPDGKVHAFKVDGQDFPWFISERGPQVSKLADDFYTIDVEILGVNKKRNDKGECNYLEVGFRPYLQPVIGDVTFPWTITEDGWRFSVARTQLPIVHLAFFAHSVDVQGVDVDDRSAAWVNRVIDDLGGNRWRHGNEKCSWCGELTDNLYDHIPEKHPERFSISSGAVQVS